MKKLYLLILFLVFYLNQNAQIVYGIDVSGNNGTITNSNWSSYKAAGVEFAFEKATEGKTYTSYAMSTNIANGTAAQVRMGVYHFALPEDNTAISEANYFLNNAGNYVGASFLPPSLDIEDPSLSANSINKQDLSIYYGGNMASLAQWINDWCTIVHNSKNIWPVLYVNKCYAGALYPFYLSGTINSNIKLWIADYTNPAGSPNNSTQCASSPWVGWPWLFHQFYDPGALSPPISASNVYPIGMDRNAFNGSLTDLNTLVGGTSCSQPSNDYCSTPATLIPSASCTYTQGSTCNATPPTNGLATTCSINSPPDDDVWYQFIATSTSHTITLQAITSTFDGVIQLMSGTCPSSLSNVECANNFGVGSTETLTATGLTIGNTYLIRIFSNGNGIANTGDFNICVTTSTTCNPVSVTTQPTNQAATVGGTATFSVVAGGTAPFTYQWYKNGVAISGATNASYQTPTLSASDNGNTYYCHITNCSGSNSMNTNTVVLTVTSTCTGASIATQPSNQSTTVGNTVTFSISVNGTAPFTYQWYKNGVAISGAMNYFYTTPSLTLSDNGNTYYCYVTNCSGNNSTTSNTATLTVTNTCNAVSIATQPTNQSATVGGTATFSVTANGTAPFTYQWYKNGVAISGATNNSYTTPMLSISDNGNYYYCIVTNCNGSYNATSNNATLTVVSSCTAVSMVSQTNSQYTTVGGTATFAVTVTGTAPFTYQWYKNGTIISGANSSSYTTPSLTLSDNSNTYYCVVTNCSGANSITSSQAYVSVTTSTTCTNCPCWNWAKSSSGTISGTATGNIAIDSFKNSYVTGTFTSASISFDTFSLASNGGNDIFLIKYDSIGKVVWAKNVGSSGNDEGYGVAVDKYNNVFLTGSFGGSSITFGGTTLSNAGSFIVKYNSSGNVLWATKTTSKYYINKGNCIATDKDGNVCITGSYFSSGINYNEIIIEKYSPLGSLVWTTTSSTSTAYCIGGGIASDSLGNWYITGRCSYTTRFPGSMYGLPTGLFLLQLNPNGSVVNLYGVNGGGTGTGIVVSDEYIHVTGFYTGTITHGSTTVTSNGNTDILYARYNYGNLIPRGLWSFGGVNDDEGYNLATNSNGDIFMTGSFNSSSLSFPISNNITNLSSYTNAYDGFVVEFTSGFGGNHTQWAKAINGSQTRSNGIAVAPQGTDIFLTGDFLTNAIFNNDTLTANSGYNIFTTKLNFSGTAKPSTINGNTSVCVGSTQTYSISPVSGATSYVWQATNGSVSGTGTSVSVTWNNTSTGTIQVASQNSCGLSAYQTLNVTLNGAPAQPSSISGNSSPCKNSTHTYSISPVSGATSYVWQATNGTVTGSGTSISVTWNGSSTGVVQVAAVSACAQSAFRILNVTLASPPNQPGAISGNTNPCASSTVAYSISSVAGAIGYNWLCTNGTVTGSGTSVTVTWNSGTSGTLQVAAQNSCGLSSYQTLNVTLNNPPTQPSLISGIMNPCQGSTNSYSISSVANATSYNWTLPSGWQGNSNTTNINAIANNTSGSISVSAVNTCGSSATQSLSVNSIPLPNIVVNSPTICLGQTAVLVASGGSSYSWSSGLSSNGDTAFASPINTSNYAVVGTLNGCSNTAYSTVTVNSPLSGSINSLPIVVCFNHSPISITGTPMGGTFSGFGVSGTTFNPSNAIIGANTITYAYTSNGCIATTSQNIQVDTLVTPTIAAIGNTSFCIGDSVTLIGNINNGVWSNSATSTSITVNANGTYFLTNTTTCGSVNSNQINVTVKSSPTIPTIQVNGNSLGCNTSSGVSYQWYLNGALLSSDTLQFLTAISTGYYSIVVTDKSSGCSSTSIPVYVVMTGITSNSISNLLYVYPNPTNGKLYIITSLKEYDVQLYDAIGAKLYSGKNDGSIDLSLYAKGIYYIVLNGTTVKKIIRE